MFVPAKLAGQVNHLTFLSGPPASSVAAECVEEA